MAGLLLLLGVFGLVLQGASEAQVKFDKIGSVIDDGSASSVRDKFVAEGNFKVDFPIKPRVSTETLDGSGSSMDLTRYLALRNGVGYVVASVPVPPGAGDFDLTRLGPVIADEVKGELVSATPTTFQAFNALEVVVKKDGDLVREMVVVAPSRMLQLGVFGGEADDYIHFRDSLEIL